MPDDDTIGEHEASTFSPWLPESDDPVSQIHISGSPELQSMILILCYEYKDIFLNKLSRQPAAIPPFGWNVKDPQWRVNKNRQPPRPQSVVNQIEITGQLNILMKEGIIEKSTAAYYSQGFW